MDEQNPTIKVEPETKAKLDKIKLVPEESYNNVIVRLLKRAEGK